MSRNKKQASNDARSIVEAIINKKQYEQSRNADAYTETG